MADEFTLRELEEQTGMGQQTLLAWRELGLIGTRESDCYTANDVLRSRIVQLVMRRGVELETIRLAERKTGFINRDVKRLFPRGLTPRYTPAEAAERGGVDLDWVMRYVEAADITDEEGFLGGDDVAAIRASRAVVAAGFPEQALLQTLRVYWDAMERAAQAGQRGFHVYVHQQLLAAGVEPASAREQTERLGAQTNPGAEQLLMFLYRKAYTRALGDDIALHVLEDMGLSPVPDVPGEVSRAVMFTDLSSYTPMVEAMGDSAAAEVLERFARIVRDAARRGLGQVVKQIGDAFMLAFPDPGSAVRAALLIEERGAAEGQFPAVRSGIHFGRVLYREADYVGAVVNVASRLITEAQRHQILVTADVRAAAKHLQHVQFVALGKRSLKGLPEALDLFEVRRAAEAEAGKTIDPVCGMELSQDEAVARLTWEGSERAFCSDTCLRLFVEAPARYGSAAANSGS
jgi:class 3 adenylate cyclase/YHS domain-containing protein